MDQVGPERSMLLRRQKHNPSDYLLPQEELDSTRGFRLPKAATYQVTQGSTTHATASQGTLESFTVPWQLLPRH
jgi:hypothetical protein